MPVSLFFFYFIATIFIFVFFSFVSYITKSPRMMRIAEAIMINVVVAMISALVITAVEEPKFWIHAGVFTAVLAFFVWALFKNAADRRRAGRPVIHVPPVRRGRRWDRDERPPVE